jgi:hypothetical protein
LLKKSNIRYNLTRLLISFTLLILLAYWWTGSNLDPRLEGYLKTLREHKEEIHNKGDVLEVLVRDFLRKILKQQYSVIGNLLYYGENNRILGELDVVILMEPKKDFFKVAIFVEEVKLWQNHKKALKKARQQLERFKSNLKAGKITRYQIIKGGSGSYFNHQFVHSVALCTWGPKGSKKSGFDHEFDLTPEEGDLLLTELRK